MSTRLPQGKRWITSKVLVALGGLVLAGICSCLNPTFVNQVSGGSVVPLAPGDTPFVQVLAINATTEKTLDFQFGWTPDFQGYNTAFLDGVGPEQQRGFLLGCPISQIGLGDPNDLNTPAITITLSDGSTVDVPAAAFPLVLSQGSDFVCGDSVVLTVTDDQTNGYGIRISAGRVDGATQTGPFTGPDTFEIVQLLLLSAGTPPTPVP